MVHELLIFLHCVNWILFLFFVVVLVSQENVSDTCLGEYSVFCVDLDESDCHMDTCCCMVINLLNETENKTECCTKQNHLFGEI